MNNFHAPHIPVLANQVLKTVPENSANILDLTLGFGGHASVISEKYPNSSLIGCDCDPEALEFSKKILAGRNITFLQGRFDDIIRDQKDGSADFILADLGLSSYQLDNMSRGFSFHADCPLDMRMNPTESGHTAAEVVNRYPLEDLKRIFRDYGEEKYSGLIASRIVNRRENEFFKTGKELGDFIVSIYPHKYSKVHQATRVFQAIRIEVNNELERLERLLDYAPAKLAPGGVLAIITFHSLEDRPVKNKFRDLCRGCTCPPDFPICACGKKACFEKPHGKAITASSEEVAANPRSRSAKLRILRKIP